MIQWVACKRGRALLLLAALAAACRPSPIYVPQVQPAEVRPGDTVRIAVTVANPGADRVVLGFGGEECPVTFNPAGRD